MTCLVTQEKCHIMHNVIILCKMQHFGFNVILSRFSKKMAHFNVKCYFVQPIKPTPPTEDNPLATKKPTTNATQLAYVVSSNSTQYVN